MDAYAMGRWLVEWDEQRGNKYSVQWIELGFGSIFLGAIRATECRL